MWNKSLSSETKHYSHKKSPPEGVAKFNFKSAEKASRVNTVCVKRANQGIVGWVCPICRKIDLRYCLVHGKLTNNRRNWLNEKRSLIPWGLRVPKWKKCSRVAWWLSVLPWCRERPQTAICCVEWLGRWKCLATCLDAFLSSFSTSRRHGIGRLVVSLFCRCKTVQVMQ